MAKVKQLADFTLWGFKNPIALMSIWGIIHPLISYLWLNYSFFGNTLKTSYYLILIFFVILNIYKIFSRICNFSTFSRFIKIISKNFYFIGGLVALLLTPTFVFLSIKFSPLTAIPLKFFIFYSMGPLIFISSLFQLESYESIQKFLKLLVYFTTLVLLPGILIYIKQIHISRSLFVRLRGVQHPNYESMFTLLILPFVIEFRKSTNKFRMNWTIILILLLIELILAKSRASYLAIGLVFPFYMYFNLDKYKLKRYIIIYFIVLICLVVFIYSCKECRAFFRMGENFNLSLLFRLKMWEFSWKKFMEHPLLGVGWGAFRYFPSDVYRLNVKFTTPHNQYLTFLLETGLLGFVAFILHVGIFLVMGIKSIGVLRDDVLRFERAAVIALTLMLIVFLFEARLNDMAFSCLFYSVLSVLFKITLLSQKGVDYEYSRSP